MSDNTDWAATLEAAKARLMRFTREDGFDEKHGTDTRPFEPTGAGNHVHMPTLSRIFRSIMDGIAVDKSAFTFVDIGAGKGRALMLASLYPFRRCVGVEYGKAAFEVAKKNLTLFNPPEKRCTDVSVVDDDALTYEYPEGDLFVFYFNSFFGDEAMTQRWLAGLGESLAARPRRAVLVYHQPEFAGLVEACGFLKPFGAQGLPFLKNDIPALAASIESGNYSFAVYSNFDAT